jgi:hypothetical protein
MSIFSLPNTVDSFNHKDVPREAWDVCHCDPDPNGER